MNTRTLQITLTVAVRDMSPTEYDEEGGASADELGLDEGADPTDVVRELQAYEFSECIEAALDSMENPEILASSGFMVVMGAASVKSAEWIA